MGTARSTASARSGARGWAPPLLTEIWSWQSHWNLELGVEARQPTESVVEVLGAHWDLSSGLWGPAVPTEIRSSRLRSGSAHLRSGARRWSNSDKIWRPSPGSWGTSDSISPAASGLEACGFWSFVLISVFDDQTFLTVFIPSHPARPVSTAVTWMVEAPVQVASAPLDPKNKMGHAVRVTRALFPSLGAPAQSVALENIRSQQAAAAWNVSLEKFQRLQELQSVTHVQQANMKSTTNRAVTAQLDLFLQGEILHAPNAQQGSLHQQQVPQLVRSARVKPLLLQAAVGARSAFVVHIPWVGAGGACVAWLAQCQWLMELRHVIFVQQEEKGWTASLAVLAGVDSFRQVLTVHVWSVQLDSMHQRQGVVHTSRVLEVFIQKKVLRPAFNALWAEFQVEPAANADSVTPEALPKTQLVNCVQVEPLLLQAAVGARSAFVVHIPWVGAGGACVAWLAQCQWLMELRHVIFVQQEEKGWTASLAVLAGVDSFRQVLTVHVWSAKQDSMHQRQAVVHASRAPEVFIQKKVLRPASNVLWAPFQVQPAAAATVVKGTFCGQCLMPRSKAVKLIAFRCFFLRHLLLRRLVSVSCVWLDFLATLPSQMYPPRAGRWWWPRPCRTFCWSAPRWHSQAPGIQNSKASLGRCKPWTPSSWHCRSRAVTWINWTPPWDVCISSAQVLLSTRVCGVVLSFFGACFSGLPVHVPWANSPGFWDYWWPASESLLVLWHSLVGSGGAWLCL